MCVSIHIDICGMYVYQGWMIELQKKREKKNIFMNDVLSLNHSTDIHSNVAIYRWGVCDESKI